MAIAPAASDAVLVERLRRRDRGAWEEIYRLYGERLYRFAYRLTGNPHDAADLVQETLVRALPRLERVRGEVNVGAYLLATERNLFLKGIERAKRQRPVETVPEPSGPAPIEEDPERSALLARQQEEVRSANADLAPRQRLVLALRELEDRSYAEIGELVGLNENAVAQLISRARQRLREELRLVQVDRSRLAVECQSFLPLLSAHLDGQLKGAQAERTLAHLGWCQACPAALADMREASRRHRTLFPLLPEIYDRVEDALAAPRSRSVRRRRVRLVAAAAVGSVVLAGGAVATLTRGAPEPAAAETPTLHVVRTTAVPARQPQPAPKRARRPSGTTRVPAKDTTAPVIVAPSAVTAEATGPEGAAVRYAVSARDRVDEHVTARCAPAGGAHFRLGTTKVACTARDDAGNAARRSFAVTVTDTTAPALALPRAMQLNTTAGHSVKVSYAVTARDRVDGAVDAKCTAPSGFVATPGKTTVECTARDQTGNVGRGHFVVTVLATHAPAPRLMLPSARTVEATGRSGAAVSFAAPGVRCSARSGAVFLLGTTTVRCTADRGFTIRVVDTTPPVLRLPGDLRFEAGAAVAYTASAHDRVDGKVAAHCLPDKGFPVGTTTVRCTAVDAHGNRARGSSAVTVADTKPPALALPDRLSAEATGPTGASLEYRATASDGVDGGLTPTCSPASGSTFPLGTTTVRCTARDAHGNDATGAFDVSVVDTTQPALTLPADRTVQATSAAGAQVAYTASAEDRVDGSITPSCSPASGSTFGVGSTTVTCTARDAHGNTATGSFGVQVTPLPKPDLVVRGLTGTSFTNSNVGDAAAGGFVVTVQGVGTFNFAGLAPGASITRTVTCAPVLRQVTVDPTNLVAESDEQNNSGRIPAC
jgi:RNA polymerase sigma factor (sigma-70 family)